MVPPATSKATGIWEVSTFSVMDSQEHSLADHLVRALEVVKRQLAEMKVGDLHDQQAEQIANETIAIQLHLTRIESDRAWVKEAANRATQ